LFDFVIVFVHPQEIDKVTGVSNLILGREILKTPDEFQPFGRGFIEIDKTGKIEIDDLFPAVVEEYPGNLGGKRLEAPLSVP
jgi:hypothetical protein